jgi:hypothetical protein
MDMTMRVAHDAVPRSLAAAAVKLRAAVVAVHRTMAIQELADASSGALAIAK